MHDSQVTTESFYEGTAHCPNCGKLMDPVEVLFSGPTNCCVMCRNAMAAQHAKEAMSKGR
jgi:hypothetical protein